MGKQVVIVADAPEVYLSEDEKAGKVCLLEGWITPDESKGA